MDDPLWRCLENNNNKNLTREQLELVLQKKKVSEVYNWFEEHFVTSSHQDYIKRCPLIIFQGPTGCGKTTTLRWISNQLEIPIKEYSETTDTTAISYNLSTTLFENQDHETLTQSIQRRKATKFEHFIINSIQYNTLYSGDNCDDAESEFDDDDDFFIFNSTSAPKQDPVTGIIIHIETPLSFAKQQRILVNCLQRLFKIIRDISRTLKRRIAIVFESLEGDGEIITLPSKMKLSFGIRVFKFNPIIKGNMKKLIESIVRQYKSVTIDKETMEQLVSDCDGDIRACLNTLQLIICNGNHNKSSALVVSPNVGVLNSNNAINYNYNHHQDTPMINDNHYNRNRIVLQPNNIQATKKQKLDIEREKPIRLDNSLLRDDTKSVSFFHVLGKIFYQKRLYPESANYHHHHHQVITKNFIRSVERPYPTENSTEYLADMLNMDPMNLTAWLHQHYHKFCGDYNIDKAALFLENTSIVDTTSLNSTQSTQFYEMHYTLNQLQTYLAIEATTFSLYQDQSNTIKKASHKKVLNGNGSNLVKSSVENSSNSNSNGDLYSFNKPSVTTIAKLVEDYSSLLDNCSTRLFEINNYSIDSNKLLLEYLPYLNHMSKNWFSMSPVSRTKFREESQDPLLEDTSLTRLYATFETLNTKSEFDYETRHDHLMEMIQELELVQTRAALNS